MVAVVDSVETAGGVDVRAAVAAAGAARADTMGQERVESAGAAPITSATRASTKHASMAGYGDAIVYAQHSQEDLCGRGRSRRALALTGEPGGGGGRDHAQR